MLINRAAIILKATKAAVEWINRTDPDQEGDPVTVKGVHEKCTIYFVPEEIETEYTCQGVGVDVCPIEVN